MAKGEFSNLRRRKHHRPLRRRIVIVTEGTKTEISYFKAIQSFCRDDLYLDVTAPDHSSPKHVLQKLKSIYRDAEDTSHLELWAVIDSDSWQDKDIYALDQWLTDRKENQNVNKRCANAGLLLSCPKFEFWLLLHFEDGLAIGSVGNIDVRLLKYLPNYRKELAHIDLESVQKAIERCEKKSAPLGGLTRMSFLHQV